MVEIKSEIVIIGGGVSSIGAVLTLLETEKRISVVKGSPGFSYLSRGSFPFIDRIDNEENTIDILHRQLRGILEKDEIASALRTFSYFIPMYQLSEDSPFMIPDFFGNIEACPLKPIQKLNLAGVKPGERVAVVDMWGLVFFKAPYIADRLSNLFRDIKFVPVRIDFFRRRSDPLMKLIELARLLEAKDAFERFFFTLKEGLKKYGGDFSKIVLPPILGVENWREPIEKLKSRFEIEVGEAQSPDGEIESIRLETELNKNIWDKVELIEGMVKEIKPEENVIKCVILEDDTVIEGEKFILATGNILGGGIKIEDGRIKESLLNLDLNISEREGYHFKFNDTTLWNESFFSTHPVFNIGVRADREFKPLRGGRKAFHNLWVTGSLLHLRLRRRPSLTLDYLLGWKVGNIVKKSYERSD